MALLWAGSAFAVEEVSQALVSSNETYVVNDKGESVQEMGVGQIVYVVIDPKAKNKKYKDFYRVTFDPTNLKGDGWIQRDKVKLMSAYHSVDGKDPKEYERKAEPEVAVKSKKSNPTQDPSASGAGSFLEELIKRDEAAGNVETQPQQVAAAEPAAKEDNPLQNDLEFLFMAEEGEFNETFKETKAALKESMQKKVGVSAFVASSDAFATSIMDKFSAKIKKGLKIEDLPKVGYQTNIEDAAKISTAAIPGDVNGVFFGQMSPKVGDSRLLKIKYYDQGLKQFTFEKVAKVPLSQPEKTIEKLANDCIQFLSK